MKNRKQATEWFIDKINDILPGSDNVEMYKVYFESLSDSAFDLLMNRMDDGLVTLPFYMANLNGKRLEISVLLQVGESLGVDFFQRIWLVDEMTGVKYLTPEKYFIVDLPIRRQSQHLVKGKSVTENSKFTDNMTGQATGVSKSSRFSLPEIMILESAGQVKGLEELIKVRGGDPKALLKAKRGLIDRGEYSLSEIEELDSRPVSTDTVKALLLAMHLDNNI